MRGSTGAVVAGGLLAVAKVLLVVVTATSTTKGMAKSSRRKRMRERDMDGRRGGREETEGQEGGWDSGRGPAMLYGFNCVRLACHEADPVVTVPAGRTAVVGYCPSLPAATQAAQAWNPDTGPRPAACTEYGCTYTVGPIPRSFPDRT